MKQQLTLSDVKQAATTLQGQTLETLRYKRRFHFEVEPKGLAYTPESSGKRYRDDWRRIQDVLDRFNEKNSFRAGDYKNLTWHASYLLALIHAATQE